MDIKIKTEPQDIEKDIKVERELIIESDWLPNKFEDVENEYYEEFGGECNKLHETVVKTEHFTIEYLDESNDNGEYEDDDYAESDASGPKNYSGEEDNNYLDDLETQEASGKDGSSESNVPLQLELNKWFVDNYIYRECPVCKEKWANYNDLRKHIIINHKESIEESESNYYRSGDNSGVCKKCNKQFFMCQFFRYVHSTKHSEDGANFNVCICKICNYRITKRLSVSKHILEKHPEVVEEFKSSCYKRNLKCPLCPNTYVSRRHLWFHFMDKHPHEYKAKLIYNCHLCEHEDMVFSDEETFLQHLMEKHELNSWKSLNYRKVFEDKEYFACTKCHSLFFQNDTCKLLSHFLKHESEFYWSCKFCCKKFHFKCSPVNHMCDKMVQYYEEYGSEAIADQNNKTPGETEGKIKNLQEFEKHITHVCPFCNKEFSRMLKWQHHLKTVHEIDTLKGLEMKVFPNDISKLSCIICHIVVANSPEQLHAHRFQHLPYKPYKCISCSKPLNTFKIAVTHVLNRCEDDDLSVRKISVNTRSIIEMQCALCNSQKISDLKHYEDEHNYFEEFFTKNSDNSMTCKICDKQYIQYRRNSCFVHLHHHFDEKTFKCKLCPRSYCRHKAASFHLHSHNAKPLNEKPNEKNVSKSLVFPNKENKKTNVTKLSQLGKYSVKSYVLNEFAEFISFACPECNEGITTQQSWYTHVMTEHSFFDESNLYFKEADESLKCPTCRMTLSTSTIQQQRHKLTHLPYRSFICNLCYVRCNSLGILYQHFRRRHFAQGIFECPVCRKVLETEHGRTIHLKETHPRNEWPDNLCLICYKVLASKVSLGKHLVTHEADRFRYTCEVCGTKVLAIADFTAHMNRHKIRGEIKEELADEITLQSACKNSASNDIEIVSESKDKHTNKRTYFTKSAVKEKKIKIDTE